MPLSIFSNKLRQLPKAELHCHLDGSMRPATLLELARDQRVKLPKQSADELAEFMRVDDANNLEDYLRRFDVTISVLQTEEALERAAYELAEDAHEDGVRYIEIRNAPILNVVKGLTLVEAIEAPLRGLSRAENDFGITARFIIAGLRQLPPRHRSISRNSRWNSGTMALLRSTSPAVKKAIPRHCTPRHLPTPASTISR